MVFVAFQKRVLRYAISALTLCDKSSNLEMGVAMFRVASYSFMA